MNKDLFSSRDKRVPLAELLRPDDFSGFIGQEHILGKGRLLRRLIEADRISSILLWGPPGSGKTTLARIIAKITNSQFISISAVSSGIKDAKEVIVTAKEEHKLYGKKTILFIDEIHRFNKSQQDYFLPFVENGTIILIGATTENPSFEVNAPLLSRLRVFHLRELSAGDIEKILEASVKIINSEIVNVLSALDYRGKTLPKKIVLSKGAAKFLAVLSEGDARDALNAIELAIVSTTPDKSRILTIDEKTAGESLQQKFIRYDKGADGHYDAISALHKSLRASDTDAALHYLTRMLEAGEDPLYVARRMVRFASEDIGLADPNALVQAVAAFQATHFVGMPESGVILAQCAIYLALAPKSRAVDSAYGAARDDVLNMRLDPIPLEIRNAPTKLMKDFGFGAGYKPYDKKSHLPENLKGKKYWKE